MWNQLKFQQYSTPCIEDCLAASLLDDRLKS